MSGGTQFADNLFVLGLLVAALLCALGLQHYKIQILHDSGAAIILGALVGLITRGAGGDDTHLSEVVKFKPEVFFVYLLPPIIFESGFSLKSSHFFSNFGSINAFAIVGTMVSTAVVTVFMYLLGQAGVIPEFNAIDNAIFASLISAVDPVTVLAIFKSLGADTTLDSIVFGESVLNDAVSIVLFRTLIGFADAELSASNIGIAVWTFVKIFVGSFLLGSAVGLLSAMLFRWLPLRERPHLELPIMAAFGYAPYLACECFHLSGIVGVLFGGIMMSHYTFYSLSVESRNHSHALFHGLALIAETFVFLFLGIDLVNMQMLHHYNGAYIIFAILACVLGRILNIVPISFLLNLQRSKSGRTITGRMQFMMIWAGLRGAIAYALALDIPDTVPEHARGVFLTTTSVIVVVTVIICGGSSPFFVQKLRLLRSPNDLIDITIKSPTASDDLDSSAVAAIRAKAASTEPSVPHTSTHRGPTRYTSGASAVPLLDDSIDADKVVIDIDVEGTAVASPRDSHMGDGDSGVFCKRHHDKCLHARWKRFDNGYMKRLFGGKSSKEAAVCLTCD